MDGRADHGRAALRTRAHHGSGGAFADDRVGRVVAGHAGCCAWAGRLLRCEREKRLREISRQVEGRDRHLSGAAEFVAAAAGRSVSRVHAADAEAACADRRTSGGRSVRSVSCATEKDRAKFWKDEGVAAVLRDSAKPQGLLNMTDISLSRYAEGRFRRRSYRRRLPDDLAVDEARAGHRRNRNDEHVRHEAGRGLQHRGRSAWFGKARRNGDHRRPS